MKQKLDGEFVSLEERRKDIPNEAALRRAPRHARRIPRCVTTPGRHSATICTMPCRSSTGRARCFSIPRASTRCGGLAFFAGFADTQLWETIHLSIWQDFSEGDVIFEEGSSGDSVYIVARGEASITRGGAMLNQLGAGECIGEIAFLDEATHSARPRSAPSRRWF